MTKLVPFFFWILLGLSSASPPTASELEFPTIAMEQAITLAKRHAASEKIDISESYLAAAQWHPPSALVGFWRIEWRPKKLMKGGQIIVLIYADGRITHGYGE